MRLARAILLISHLQMSMLTRASVAALTAAGDALSSVSTRGMASIPQSMKAIVARNGTCVEETLPVPAVKPGEVLVRVRYSAINRADTLQRKGQYPPPPGVTEVLGLEMTGEVVSYAPPASSSPALAPVTAGVTTEGARVMALLSGGGNAQYAAVPAAHLLPVPEGMDFKVAAAIPETWLTAFQLLHLVAQVQPGQTVLVHAAGSGVGTAAIQLAVQAGCRVFAVAGTDDKLQMARELGAFATFNYKSDPEGWPKAVVAATAAAPAGQGANATAAGGRPASPGKTPAGRGVDVILDPVGGSFWRGNAEAIAMDGMWVLYGTMGGGSVDGGILAQILRKRAKLVGTTLRSRSDEYKADLTRRFYECAWPSLANGSIRPIVDSEYPLGQAQAAHDHMESNANTGKIVLKME